MKYANVMKIFRYCLNELECNRQKFIRFKMFIIRDILALGRTLARYGDGMECKVG